MRHPGFSDTHEGRQSPEEVFDGKASAIHSGVQTRGDSAGSRLGHAKKGVRFIFSASKNEPDPISVRAKSALARPLPARQTARKGRLNFPYSVVRCRPASIDSGGAVGIGIHDHRSIRMRACLRLADPEADGIQAVRGLGYKYQGGEE